MRYLFLGFVLFCSCKTHDPEQSSGLATKEVGAQSKICDPAVDGDRMRSIQFYANVPLQIGRVRGMIINLQKIKSSGKEAYSYKSEEEVLVGIKGDEVYASIDKYWNDKSFWPSTISSTERMFGILILDDEYGKQEVYDIFPCTESVLNERLRKYQSRRRLDDG